MTKCGLCGEKVDDTYHTKCDYCKVIICEKCMVNSEVGKVCKKCDKDTARQLNWDGWELGV